MDKNFEYDSSHTFYELLKVFEEVNKTPLMVAFNKRQKIKERKEKIKRILYGKN